MIIRFTMQAMFWLGRLLADTRGARPMFSWRLCKDELIKLRARLQFVILSNLASTQVHDKFNLDRGATRPTKRGY